MSKKEASRKYELATHCWINQQLAASFFELYWFLTSDFYVTQPDQIYLCASSLDQKPDVEKIP
ncbi:hypothetical protein ACSFXN_06860 [Planococcus sp. 1R117A]|uniref:hypothetical protein n=1 Tax=Planococcus sp. 1R117A TaxID=3447020 RepID=UPI003EDC92D4